MNKCVAAMVCLDGHGCKAAGHRGQEYRGRDIQGAMLDKQPIRIGCHRTRMYTITSRCSVSGRLRGAALHPRTNMAKKQVMQMRMGILVAQDFRI